MTPQRIEEFRRRLREGRPVRVVGGQVIDGADGKPLAVASRQSPDGAAEGVYVKPHDWGAAPFYGTPDGEKRALKEQALLDREYPGFALDVDDDGTAFAVGGIGPTSTLRGRYQVLVELPPGYGEGVLPRAYLLDPAVRAGAPHVYNDGSLCVDHSGAFTRRSTLITFLAWVAVWHNAANALLNLGYVLLGNEIASRLEAAGFDPRIGYFHGLRYGRSSLALDLLEPHGAPVIDRLTLSVLSRRMFSSDDFEDRGGDLGVRLAPAALRRYLTLYEANLGEPPPTGAAPRARIQQQVDRLRRASTACAGP